MDRLGSVFGPRNGPLVAHWLRFYFRHARFRTMYPLALPLGAFLFFVVSKQTKGATPLAGALDSIREYSVSWERYNSRSISSDT